MKTRSRTLLAGILLAFGTGVGCDGTGGSIEPNPAGEPGVIDQDITVNRTLYADTVYTLRGFIKVTNGATLTIQPGTRIQGDYNTVGSSLFVLRGARIVAEGTADRPIVFTSSRPEGQRMPGDWGGLVLVGNGIVNRGQPVVLEGTGTGADNPAVDYSGGNDNTDSSGTLRYVRIEFAGYATAQDAELNSLTMAAVGSGTTIENVQVLAGLDDSYEWFGGAVDGRYLISYESGDDHFDASEGYSGRNQFLIAYQSKQLEPRHGAGSVASDPRGIENDGCAGENCLNGQDSEPFTTPVFANFTLVGPGEARSTTSGEGGMVIRRGAGGHYVNGVVARFSRAAISLRDEATRTRLADGRLSLGGLLLAENGAAWDGDFTVPMEENGIEASPLSAAALFNGLPTDPSRVEQFDWTPAPDSPARSGGLTSFTGDLAARAGAFVTPTAYRGAADPNGSRWWEGWTYYADN